MGIIKIGRKETKTTLIVRFLKIKRLDYLCLTKLCKDKDYLS